MQIEPGDRLKDCPTAPLSGHIPSPVSERLDVLVGLANGAGAATNRAELVSALILYAAEDSDGLLGLVVAMRRSKAADASVQGVELARVLTYEKHSPGRRPRASTA